jgi:hypothetical protein
VGRKISLKRAWRWGYEAARRGDPPTANPFDNKTGQFQSWHDGWHMDATLDPAARGDMMPKGSKGESAD